MDDLEQRVSDLEDVCDELIAAVEDMLSSDGQEGRKWSGRKWSGRKWSGRKWSGRKWAGRKWALDDDE